MTLETFNKIKRHIDVIEMVALHSGDSGHGYAIIGELVKLQKEYNPNAMPVDTSCGNCIITLFKDVYRHYKLNEDTFSK